MIFGIRPFSNFAALPKEIARGCIKNQAVLLNAGAQLLNLGTNFFLIGYGAKEIILDSHPNWCRITPHSDCPKLIQKVLLAADGLLMMIRNHPTGLADKCRFTAHGLLMIGTGIAGTFIAIEKLGLISLGPALRLFSFAAGGFFFLGNLIYLEYNIQKFVAATRQHWHKGTDKAETILKQIAAAIGIVSNLAYLAASIATFAGAPFFYPLFLGLVGMFAGGLRILLDSYIVWKTAPANMSKQS